MLPILLFAFFPASAQARGGPPDAAEGRALAFLAREVPSWPAENKCFSCHNNGVAASALYQARRRGHKVADEALATTTRWLTAPAKWDYRREGGTATDRALSLIQFSAALVDATDAKAVEGRAPLREAARLVAAEQQKDGSWKVSAEGTLGSPATLGDALATHLARRTLLRADAVTHRDAVARADRWLREVKVATTVDAAAVLLALAEDKDDAAAGQRRRSLELLRRGEDKAGGWGPRPGDAVEAFDTAVALLALANVPATRETKAMIRRGRDSLVRSRQDDGAWEATTRPAGAVSYAQRVATAGWALQALLATATPSGETP